MVWKKRAVLVVCDRRLTIVLCFSRGAEPVNQYECQEAAKVPWRLAIVYEDRLQAYVAPSIDQTTDDAVKPQVLASRCPG